VVLHTNRKRSRVYGFVGWVGFQETHWPGSDEQLAPPVTLWYAEFRALMGVWIMQRKVLSNRRSLLLDSFDEPSVGATSWSENMDVEQSRSEELWCKLLEPQFDC
jgi:hypothetical protein